MVKEKSDAEDSFEAEKNKEIEESIGVLMEVPNICAELSEMIVNKSSLLVCPVCNEKSEENIILVNSIRGKQVKCFNCSKNDSEYYKWGLEGNMDCSQYIKKVLEEIELFKTIQKRIKSKLLNSQARKYRTKGKK